MSKGNQKTPNLVIEWSPKGVTTYDAASGSVRHFESAAAAAAAVGGGEVIAAVSRRSVFVRTTRVPDAAIADVRLVLSMKLGDLFPLAASDLAYDFLLTDDVDAEGRMAVVVAMPAQDIRRLQEELRSAGFKVKQVIPSAFGSVALAESLARTSAAVVTEETDGIGIDIIEGRQLRYSRLSTNVANPTAEVCRTYTVSGIPTAEVIASGGLQFADADVTTHKSTLEALLASPLGLPTIDLEPPEEVALRAKKAHDRRQAIALTSFALALALTGYAWFDTSSRAAAVEAVQTRQRNELSGLEKKQNTALGDLANLVDPITLAKFTPRTTTKQSSKTRTTATPNMALGTSNDSQTAIDLGFKYGQRFSDIVTVVVNGIPSGLWVNAISLERGKRLVLRGTASTNDQIAAFVHNLEGQGSDAGDDPRLRDVRLEFTNNGSIDQTPVVQFSVSAFPIGNVPLVDPNQVKLK